MIVKQLFLLLASVFLNLRRRTAGGPQENFTDAIHKAVSSEVSKIGYKLMAGLVLVAVVIFSIVQFGQAIEIWLSQYENGYIYQIVTFGSIAVLCSWGLYRLFHKEDEPERLINPQIDVEHLTVKNVASEFMKGFFNGYHAPRSHAGMANALDQKNIY